MSTFYGLNPSFVYNSPLPLFANLIRRAKRIEADGSVKLMEETTKEFVSNLVTGSPTVITRRPSGLLTAATADGSPVGSVVAFPTAGGWHRPSLEALASLRPAVLRTLDWQMTNKRPDWAKMRVLPTDLMQGTDRGMAVELQAEAANLLKCHLWWCAPPRFELPAAEYDVRLESMLLAIRDTATRPPILEYGNELWNAGFPVHGWLQQEKNAGEYWDNREPASWHVVAAHEIAALKRVADRVFGSSGPLGARPYYLFVGGQLTVPSHLDRILSALADLGVTPDLAGPALYVTPLKAHKEEWEATGAVPTQEELRSSCFARLAEIGNLSNNEGSQGPLKAHVKLCARYGVPYFACYEAGQSLIAGSHPWRRAAIEAQKTEWMGELYREIRLAALAAGVDLLNWYSAATDQTPTDARVDVFGLLEGTDLSKMLPKALAARGD